MTTPPEHTGDKRPCRSDDQAQEQSYMPTFDSISKRRRITSDNDDLQTDLDGVITAVEQCHDDNQKERPGADDAKLLNGLKVPVRRAPATNTERDAVVKQFQALFLEYDSLKDQQRQPGAYSFKRPGMMLKTPKRFPCPLLGLPAELRNKIWRYTLLEGDTIVVSASNNEQPGLLMTSKQVRDETVRMYHYGNEFKLTITDFKLEPHFGHWSWNIMCERDFVGKASRSNMMDFAKQHYHAKLDLMPSQLLLPRLALTVRTPGLPTLVFAIRIVEIMQQRKVPWTTVEAVLDTYMRGIRLEQLARRGLLNM